MENHFQLRLNAQQMTKSLKVEKLNYELLAADHFRCHPLNEEEASFSYITQHHNPKIFYCNM